MSLYLYYHKESKYRIALKLYFWFRNYYVDCFVVHNKISRGHHLSFLIYLNASLYSTFVRRILYDVYIGNMYRTFRQCYIP